MCVEVVSGEGGAQSLGVVAAGECVADRDGAPVASARIPACRCRSDVPADGNSYSAFGPDVIGPGPTGSSEDLRLR